MEIRFIGIGLSRSEKSVGSILRDSLSDPTFSTFTCFVAFLSMPAVKYLSPIITKAKEHINEFRVFLGIDQKGTSKEALKAMLDLDIGASIYYTFSHVIFHPKIYILEGNVKRRIILGSSNLTLSGLFQNIEASVIIDFAKPDKEGEKLLEEIYYYFKPFFGNELENIHPLTQELIQLLFEAGVVPDEAERKKQQEEKAMPESSTEINTSSKSLRGLFPPIKIQRPPVITTTKKKTKEAKFKTIPTDKGTLLWKKSKLPGSDVQYAGEGSNPTGGLRLTQARWEVRGKRIDQTTYFRKKVFGTLDWREVKTPPGEKAEVLFNVNILGEDHGQHQLTIRHKPSGEASQGNYTTLLSWGVLGDTIRNMDLRGRNFLIYAPTRGKKEPFYIEIR